ncbi:MAG: molybdopterin-dependent oxidoreductase [Pseudomonadota bacterium]
MPQFPTATHWGVGLAETDNDQVVKIDPYPGDPAPSKIMQGLPDAMHGRARITRPAIRKGYLESGKASRATRGQDPFVEVPWDEALDIAATELQRIRDEHSNEAIFAGSYGWASAGRFHHAQSQIHRFMNCFGGYTASVDNYSYAVGLVLLPHIVGSSRQLLRESTVWPVIKEHGELVVLFGGVPRSNLDMTPGGVGRHTGPHLMRDCKAAGVEFINIGPSAGDLATELEAEWLPLRPNTDTALMIGLAHTLLIENLHDQAFLDNYTVGFERFQAYLLGETDGVIKDAAWAANITEIPAETIQTLARKMARQRTLICTVAGIQRADHGEQPLWMTVMLASMLGQIGVPGGGFGFFYGADSTIGTPVNNYPWPALSQGQNPVKTFIPVARISDMLLYPGEPFSYNGQALTYPDIKLVYWAGGNPFHHHQDLNRLIRAFQQPDTVIVNEIWWTSTARHADIVFPVTTMLERNDLGMSRHDTVLVAMHQAVSPVGEARNDYDIFSGLAERLAIGDAFTEQRDAWTWLQSLWSEAIRRGEWSGLNLPDFETFWKQGILELPHPPEDQVLLKAFREDPINNPIATPSGKIELFSETIAGFSYADCPGHPVWLEPYEWLGSPMSNNYPLHLISSQPPVRLHSQLDSGSVSRQRKIAGREPVTMHPTDAEKRGIVGGDVVRIYNDRGACLAGVTLSTDIRPGVIRLCTGAWFDPETPGVIGALDKHGNPNVLTRDKGTSSLSQGPTAHTSLVEIEKFEGELPSITAFDPPPFVKG